MFRSLWHKRPKLKILYKNYLNNHTILINMNETKYEKIRTVTANERGQIVIPEDVRKDLHIKKASTMVLIKKGEELVLRREADILGDLEDPFWKSVAQHSLENAWSKEDEIWDKIYQEQK